LVVPDYNSGAMENVAAVTFNEFFISRGEATRRERIQHNNVILHEMAHMWFGDIATMTWWTGLWLDESFATVIAAVAPGAGNRVHVRAGRNFLSATSSGPMVKTSWLPPTR